MNERKFQTVWITKYALSKGIYQEKVGLPSEDSSEYRYSFDGWTNQFCKGDWFESHGEAIKNAEERRTARIASLKKQIAKLEKMSFS